MTWYETAKSSIAQTKIDNPGLSRSELKKRCSQNYPFGVRKYYPYKAWLRAMNDEFGSKRQLQQAQKYGQCDMFLPLEPFDMNEYLLTFERANQ